MSNVIRIQSSKTIVVTSGLQCNDVTNPDAHIPDRLKVSAEWPKHSIMIMEGVHEYPAEIAKWDTVKALVNDGILTIAGTPQIMKAETEVRQEDIEKIQELKADKVRKIKEKAKAKSLDELAGEE